MTRPIDRPDPNRAPPPVDMDAVRAALGEDARRLLAGVCAVSNPLDLMACARKLEAPPTGSTNGDL